MPFQIVDLTDEADQETGIKMRDLHLDSGLNSGLKSSNLSNNLHCNLSQFGSDKHRLPSVVSVNCFRQIHFVL